MLKDFFKEHGEGVRYIICGIITTAVSWTCRFAVLILAFGGTEYPDVVQSFAMSAADWTSGVACSYLLNRFIVFRESSGTFREFCAFVASRAATLLLNWLLTWFFSVVLHVNAYIATVLIAGIVMVTNWLLCRYAVFGRKKP